MNKRKEPVITTTGSPNMEVLFQTIADIIGDRYGLEIKATVYPKTEALDKTANIIIPQEGEKDNVSV